MFKRLNIIRNMGTYSILSILNITKLKSLFDADHRCVESSNYLLICDRGPYITIY